MKTKGGVLFIFLLILPLWGQARPEYAARHGLVSCTACHASPSGGGIRTEYGKIYGARGFETNDNHERPYYQVDARAILTTTQEVREGRNGFALMELLGAVNVPVLDGENQATNFVASYYFGAFNQAVVVRDTYVRWQNKKSDLLEYVTVGKFIAPFGLLTDEHRTYTRWQSRSTWNNFDMGAMLSGKLLPELHWDFAAVNGFQASATEGEGNFSTGDTYGLYLNLRSRPFKRSLLLGASGSFYRRHSGQESPYAVSVYSALGLEGLTGGRLRGSLLAEYVRSQYWSDGTINPEFGRVFAGGLDSGYVDALKYEIAEGYYLQLLIDMTRNLALQYKWDKFIPSVNYRGDFFERYGLGFRWQASANLQWMARAEWVDIGRPDVEKAAAGIAADNYWLLAHYWF